MATEDTILAILTGRKEFDGRVWHVYDASDAELVDAGGVLWRGVHGALLWNVNTSIGRRRRSPSGIFLFGQLGNRDPRH